jgi:hypothetical protein
MDILKNQRRNKFLHNHVVVEINLMDNPQYQVEETEEEMIHMEEIVIIINLSNPLHWILRFLF